MFQSRFSILGTCTFCKSTLVHHKGELSNIGKVADMLPDMSPLQLGTQGMYRNQKFTLVGRVKMGWSHGYWNEWYLNYSDGSDGWLGVAQGLYMMSEEYREAVTLPRINGLAVGQAVYLLDTEYIVDDIRTTQCMGTEGELPYRIQKGEHAQGADLVNSDGGFANISGGDKGVQLFLGSYVEVEELHLTGLKKVEGWSL